MPMHNYTRSSHIWCQADFTPGVGGRSDRPLPLQVARVVSIVDRCRGDVIWDPSQFPIDPNCAPFAKAIRRRPELCRNGIVLWATITRVATVAFHERANTTTDDTSRHSDTCKASYQSTPFHPTLTPPSKTNISVTPYVGQTRPRVVMLIVGLNTHLASTPPLINYPQHRGCLVGSTFCKGH